MKSGTNEANPPENYKETEKERDREKTIQMDSPCPQQTIHDLPFPFATKTVLLYY
jgi:hypothetical protein